MYFYYEQIVPVLTTEDNKVIFTAHLAVGLLDFVDVGIPLGVNRLAKCQIYYNQFQLVPFNRNYWFTGNNATIRIPIQMQLLDNLPELEIYCINLDDTFSHELSFGISIDVGKLTTQSSVVQQAFIPHVVEG